MDHDLLLGSHEAIGFCGSRALAYDSIASLHVLQDVLGSLTAEVTAGENKSACPLTCKELAEHLLKDVGVQSSDDMS